MDNATECSKGTYIENGSFSDYDLYSMVCIEQVVFVWGKQILWQTVMILD